jgi:hypothetical protein
MSSLFSLAACPSAIAENGAHFHMRYQPFVHSLPAKWEMGVNYGVNYEQGSCFGTKAKRKPKTRS